MKNILLPLVILLTSACAWSQTTYTGTITSASNTILNEASVKSLSEEVSVSSNQSGEFEITLNNNNEVEISFIGYKTLKTNLEPNKNNIITLYKDINSLHEIVVSGNREQQKRNEVPAAISVISAEKINITKPIGIEDLVNDVPGVFMSSSKAASNEQHFTSIRSPISTDALFLFLEDGIAIRPTSVFNHNALLEMNLLAHERVEVLKGPNSSIYGSEAIGGSFNFITKKPTKDWSGSIVSQINDLGYKNIGAELSKTIADISGWYVAANYSERIDGPVDYSDYEKQAFTVNNVNDVTESLTWTNSLNIVDYRSDTAGSIGEANYFSGEYETDQTFTNRVSKSLRYKSRLEQKWDNNNKTTLNLIYRDNTLNQIPSFRINRAGTLGEKNSNQFKSYAALAQHKLDFNFMNASLIAGGTVDFSQQDYVANTIDVFTNENGIHESFTFNANDFILNYEADILNYAGFAQFEISPIEKLKITLGARYDEFEYDFDNQIAGSTDDRVDSWNHFAPKVGVNFNLFKNAGVYANYSNGFTPPQASTLYRNSDEISGIKPSTYHNTEFGGYFTTDKITIDAAFYLLEGSDTLITIRNDDDANAFIATNAGKTRSYGFEYGLKYKPIDQLTLTHNGTASFHKYVRFIEDGVDYSNTDRQTAPNIINTTKINYTPKFAKGLNIGITYEHTGEYNTSFENEIVNDDGTTSTATYDGHHIFNGLVSYKVQKIEVWAHVLNIFDDLYSLRTSYSFGQNTFTIGNPRAFQLGVKYSF